MTAITSTNHIFIDQYILDGSHTDWIINGGILLIVMIFVVWPYFILPLFDYLDFRRLVKVESVFLELSPPNFSVKTAHANNQLFAVLHGLYSIRSFNEKLLHHKQVISYETVSSREGGIRFIVRLPADSIEAFKHTIISYLPDVQFKEVEDYVQTAMRNGKWTSLLEFKQSRHFAYPLKTNSILIQHDPIAYITGALAKPEVGESIILQIVVSPAISKAASRVRNKLIVGKEPGILEFSWKLPFMLIFKLIGMVIVIFGIIIRGTVCLLTSSNNLPRSSRGSEYQRPITRALQEIDDKLLDKLSQPLFHADIRAFIAANEPRRIGERTAGLISTLSSFHDPGFQSLVSKRYILIQRRQKFREFSLYKFVNRLPSAFTGNSCLLSAEEVANIYHFPYGNTAQVDNLLTSLSKTLAAPISLKQDKRLDILIGKNEHHGLITPIGLMEAERERHVYIIGGTGNGKTTMMFYCILQDIWSCKGIAVIDPHGDLAERILRYIPEGRIEDVIYMNPDDLAYPIGVNLLELPEGITGDDLLREKDLVTEATISVLRKVFSDDDSGGHRIEYVLRNSIQTALTLENPTLFTIYELLNDAKFRGNVIKGLEDKNLIDFWKNELGKAGEFQRVKMAAGITSKIGRFLFSASAKRVLEQSKSTIDFNNILESKKIFICNFSKGLLGEDTSALFGTTILAMLQSAALRCARVHEVNREPFYLYVDEFQNFATISFVQMLSEARKYKLLLTMAEQSTSQQDKQRLVDIILANVGTIVCFRSGSPADERLVLPLFQPYLQPGDIANLPAYSYYVRIAAVQTQEPMSGVTEVVEEQGNNKAALRVIETSRKRYSKYTIGNSEGLPAVTQDIKMIAVNDIDKLSTKREGHDEFSAINTIT